MWRMLRHLDTQQTGKNQAQLVEWKEEDIHLFDTVDVDALQVLGAFDEYGGHQVTKAIKQVSENNNYDQSTAHEQREKAAAT